MKKRLKSVAIGAMAAVLMLPLVSMKMQTVNITQPMETTVSIVVPVLSGPAMAHAVCDPSEGRHPGLALVCFLQWLMEVTDASTGF